MIVVWRADEQRIVERWRQMANIGSVEGLQAEIVRLNSVIEQSGTKKAQELSTITSEVVRLKQELADLQIQKAKQEEDWQRQDREIRHMVGLEKKRQEVENAQAKREAALEVREANLKAEQERFAEQLAFNTQRFEKMEAYLKDMMGDILKRLPNISMDIIRTGDKA